MDHQTPLSEKEFLQLYIITELERLQASGFHYYSFVLMGQSIELLGSFLDTKPFRARHQSGSRFDKAIYKLFDARYTAANKDGFLYIHLRCNFSHLFVPSGHLLLMHRATSEGYTHLEMKDGKLVLIAEDLFEDLKKACLKLCRYIDEGKIKPKKIGVDFLQFGM